MKKQKNLNFREKNKKNNRFSNKGITLIALIITIIILLILAGVSIAFLTGENGIIKKAELAKNKTDEAQVEENVVLANYEDKINEITENRENVTITKDEYEKLKNRGEYELIGEGKISSTADKIELNKSIENYRYLLLNSHLNTKENNDWVDNTIIPAQLNFYNSIVLEHQSLIRINTVYLSTNTTLSVSKNQTKDSTWASTYILIYGIK